MAGTDFEQRLRKNHAQKWVRKQHGERTPRKLRRVYRGDTEWRNDQTNLWKQTLRQSRASRSHRSGMTTASGPGLPAWPGHVGLIPLLLFACVSSVDMSIRDTPQIHPAGASIFNGTAAPLMDGIILMPGERITAMGHGKRAQ